MARATLAAQSAHGRRRWRRRACADGDADGTQRPRETALTAQTVLTEIESALPIQYGTTWLSESTEIDPLFYELDEPLLGDGCIGAGEAAGAGCSRRVRWSQLRSWRLDCSAERARSS